MRSDSYTIRILIGCVMWGGATCSLQAQFPQRAPVNPAFLRYQQDRAPVVTTPETVSEHGLGYRPSPLDLSHLRDRSAARMRLRQSPLPSSYDLRTQGKLTPIKNQGIYGTCWAFASFGSLESWLLPTETHDFSENNLANTAGFDWGFDEGGNASVSIAYLARWSGPINTADDPYPNPGNSPSNLTAQKHVQEALFLPLRTNALDNTLIKQAVMTYGAMYVSMYMNTSYYDALNTSYYYNGTYPYANHAVAIVGWDDDFPSNRFSHTASVNGAFIVRNSWGTSWGDSGYFYCSYDDAVMGYRENVMFNNAETVTNYDTVYQYDPLGWVSSWGYGSTNFWGANIFTATSSILVRAVGFYTTDINTRYELNIYRDVTANQPRSGTLETAQTGTLSYSGYHTIALNHAVAISSGQLFSAVIRFTTPSYTFPVPVEYALPNYSSHAVASPGQSFISANGDIWGDLTDWDSTANVCIKAFADFYSIPLMITASSGAYEDRIALSWVPQADATAYEIWRAQNTDNPGEAIYLTYTTTPNYNDTSADAGVIYYYWIKARTPSGTTDFNYYASGWRSWNYIPSGVTASDGTYADKVAVNWTASSNAVGGYTVYRSVTSADSDATPIGGTMGVVFNDTSATPGVNYCYWLKGIDAGGIASGFSLPDSGWRATTPPPDPEGTNIPALRATDFQWAPTSLQIGGSPSLAKIRIVNTSAAATSAWVTLTFYLSSDSVFGSLNNIALGSIRRSVSLAAGQSVDLNLNSVERATLCVPSTTALGYYTVFMKATSAYPASTNNVLALAMTIRVVPSRLANRNDFDSDGKTDLAIYQPSTGVWKIRGSAMGNEATFACGGPGYAPVSGDYDGDGKADLAVYQASSGMWLFLLSGSLYNSAMLENFGGQGYVPVSGDYDGDGKSDPAVYNASTGVWSVQLSGSSYDTASVIIGSAGCKAVSGDYDGDGKSDPAVYQPANSEWQVMMSGNNYALVTSVFGDADCVPIPGDFDGDLKSDPAVYRETDGLWAVMLSASSYAVEMARLGGPGFVEVSGDYDGDGKTDLTVYRSDDGHWYSRLSQTAYSFSSFHFGGPDFIPIGMGD